MTALLRTALAAAALGLCPLQVHAQIISSWDRPGSVVTNLDDGLIDDDTYAAQGLFMDWSDQMEEMERTASATEKEILTRIGEGEKGRAEHTFRSRKGSDFVLPEMMSPDGTDLYMLTKEGITIYMALDAPVFFQEVTDEVVNLVRYFAYTKKAYTRGMFRRYEGWEGRLKAYFESQGIPPELTELCLVESGCTYTALSPAGARGMWQIMPGTARDYGLTVDLRRDDREDPVLSTEAAARILRDNYGRVGEWTLAAAAYNCGAGRIQRFSDRGMGWDEVRPHLPGETQRYIPALMAVHYVWTYRDRLGLE